MINTEDGFDAISGRRKRVTLGTMGRLLVFALLGLLLVLTISILL